MGSLNDDAVPVPFVEPAVPEPARVVTSGLSVYWSAADRLIR